MPTLKDTLKPIRIKKGFTQKKLGELCGINEVQIRNYELGNANPKLETIKRIAEALDVPYTDLLDPSPWEQIQKELTSDLDKQLQQYGITSIYNLIYKAGYTVATNLYDPNDFIFEVNYPDGTKRGFTLNELIDLQNDNLSYLKFKLDELKCKK